MYPSSLQEFQNKIIDDLGTKKLPVLTKNNPEETKDGNYVIQAEDFLKISPEKYYVSDTAWVQCVKDISETKAFKDKCVVFLRADMKKDDAKHRIIGPKIKHNSWYLVIINRLRRERKYTSLFKIQEDKNYYLTLTYRYPNQKRNTNDCVSINVRTSDIIKAMGENKVKVNMLANSIEWEFTTKRFLEYIKGNIYLEFIDETAEKREVIGPVSKINFEVKKPISYLFFLVIAIMILPLGTTLISYTCPPNTTITISEVLKSINVVNLTGAIVQMVAMLFLYKSFGKKII